MSEETPAVVSVRKPDEVKLFFFYCLFGGDAKRVSVVSRVPVDVVESLAHDFRWKDKAAGHATLDTEEGKDLERAFNRAAVYHTSTRLGHVFDNLVAALDADPAFARAFCTQFDDEGEARFNTKNLVELAKGLEIVANVRYRALGDKIAQAADVTRDESVAEIALKTYAQLVNKFDRISAADPTTEIKRVVEAEARARSIPEPD